MRIAESLVDLIGNTPMVKVGENIFAKMESFNPLGSVKDRAAFAMVWDAEERKILHEGSVLIEPTSGNTGIGLAFVAASRGYRLILTMPETFSIERRRMMSALGAELELTDGKLGMKGAIVRAEELLREIEGAVMLGQFTNPANPEVHRRTTAAEIWRDMAGEVDIFVSGVGTGGTITGVGEVLKARRPEVRIVAVEPEDSAVLSGGEPGPHAIQGIGAGFVPKILNRSIIDEVIKVSNQAAMDMQAELAKKQGILVGISSGAAMVAAREMAERYAGKKIVVVFPDTGERYLA